MSAGIKRILRSDGICLLTFDRPGSSANILDQPTLEAFSTELDFVEASPPKGLVITTAKPAIFIAGADLHCFEGKLTHEEVGHFIEWGQIQMNRLARLPVPTVAAIHGAALGGGYELCLACRWRIASDTAATRVGLPETTLGLVPAWGGITRLPRLVGFERALDLILSGRLCHTREALELGLVDQVVNPERLVDAACEMLQQKRRKVARRTSADALKEAVHDQRQRLRAKSNGHHIAALKALEALASTAKKAEDASLAAERAAFMDLVGTEATRNLLRLFFLEERARKPAAEINARVGTIAVIGAGTMGSGIAYWASTRGFNVRLTDNDPGALARGHDRIAKLYETSVGRGTISKSAAAEHWARLAFEDKLESALDRCELIIEAVVEKVEVKQRLFESLDQLAPRRAVLASNTSAISISDLAASTARPDQVVGLHFFNPVHRMRLVEIVAGRHSSIEALGLVRGFAQQLGKVPVLVRDSPGFVVNRVLFPYLLEAVRLLEEGEIAQAIDDSMLEFGMAMGPLRVMDEVGLDVVLDIAGTFERAFGERAAPAETLKKLVLSGRLGRKTGEGFYRHDRAQTAAGPPAGPRASGPNLKRRDLRRRLVFLMVNEAARCLEEKVAGNPADIDLAMILGTAFPSFRGGPLRYSDALGNERVRAVLDQLSTTMPRFAPSSLLRTLGEQGRNFYPLLE